MFIKKKTKRWTITRKRPMIHCKSDTTVGVGRIRVLSSPHRFLERRNHWGAATHFPSYLWLRKYKLRKTCLFLNEVSECITKLHLKTHRQCSQQSLLGCTSLCHPDKGQGMFSWPHSDFTTHYSWNDYHVNGLCNLHCAYFKIWLVIKWSYTRKEKKCKTSWAN